MNTKLLASIAVFVLLAAVVSPSLTNSAFAASDAFMKIDGVKGEAKEKKAEMKEKKDAKKAEVKAKKDAKKTAIKEKKDAKKAAIKEKKDDKKAAMKEKKDAMKDKAMAKKDAASGQSAGATAPSDAAATSITVDMAKGTGSNTECGDQCFVPNVVKVAKGGSITWTNSDSIQHTATASDGSFDTGFVSGAQSSSVTFNTAGSYDYICQLHLWMKGTVVVE